jgi:hypothetical protein
MLSNKRKIIIPVFATLVVLVLTAIQLRRQGRLWWCSCGHFLFWSSDAWGSETSQHLFDPYSFTHVLHGMIFYGLLALIGKRLAFRWLFWLAIVVESLWEVIENTNVVIQRYREATAALGYQGDSVVNSLGDIVACGVGIWLARKLGLWPSVVVFILIEVVLLLTIRDSLLFNIVMLIYPIEVLKAWQTGH